ncbi:MAG: T9SS type A sorting domain-containing protein [Bacteroidota bacterium]
MNKTFTLLIALLTLCSVAISANYNVTLYSTNATTWGGIATSSPSPQILGTGSWKNNQALSKMEFYLPLTDLGTFTIDDIASLQFSTQKVLPTPPPATNVDFYWGIYTVGNAHGWYGERLTSEPMYYNGYNAPYNVWTTYQTGSGANQMTFFDSNHSPAGYSGAPTLADIQASPIDWSYSSPYWSAGTTYDYGAQTVKTISISTGSGWNAIMLSYLDNIIITLTNGKVLIIDLENTLPNPVTTIQSPTYVTCDTYDVPVRVQDFRNIGNISLKLNYDPLIFTYQSVTVNPALAANGSVISSGASAGLYSLSYYGNALALVDNDVLYTLHFKLKPAVSGVLTNLTWSTSSGDCEYASSGSDPIVFVSSFVDKAWTIPVRPVKNLNTGLEYCKIQDAISDPATNNNTGDHDVITVAAGTYAEDIIVNKSVDLLGPKATIDGCDLSRGTGAAIVVPATKAISSGEIFHVAASNVAIKGFTIDGDNPLLTSGFTSTNGADIDAAEGVTVYETGINNLTVENNIFKNLSYFGVTLYDYPAGVPSSGHLINKNKFQDFGTYDAGSGGAFWGGGVLIYNNQYTAITNNCMTNVRIGIQTGNFSQANPGAPAFQVISGNTIEARKRGIFHNLAYGSASPYTLSGNSISGLANANETTFWDAILLSSMSVASTASINIIDGSAVTAMPTTGIAVWNCQTAPLISGGTISGVGLGINVNNFESYPTTGSNAGNTSATIDGVIINGASIAGVKVHDNPLNTNGAKAFAEIKNLSGTGNATGILMIGADAGANIHDNNIAATAIGISATGTSASATNSLAIVNNTITLSSQLAGSNPTPGILLSKITGTAAATISNNTISGAYYGYLVYNLNTTPVTNITGGGITGVMQGVAAINIDPAGGGLRAPSNLKVSSITMSGFAGAFSGSFHAGVYVYTGGAVANTSITAAVDKVNVTGTGKIAQDCAGLSFADFSTLASAGQNITVTECTLTDNLNRGINIRGLNAIVEVAASTLTGNGKDPYGLGGNDGFGIIVREGATANVHNNFITNPASVAGGFQVSALCTDMGTAASATINATHNSLSKNGNAASWLAYNGSGTLNATCNWWGTSTPAGVAAAITGTVTYIQWLVSGADLSDPGFMPDPLKCYGSPIALVCAEDQTEASCQTQIAIDAAFATWLATASASGCNGVLTNDNTGAPAACGGSKVVTFTFTSDCGVLTCTKTFTVTAAPAVQITCPNEVTVDQTQERDPYATGYAIATNCINPSPVTFDDDRSKLDLCNSTGYITRTWSVTNYCSSTATCQQKINVIDVTNPVLACPPTITQNTDPNLCSAVVTFNPTAKDFGFFQGFENPAWLSGNAPNSPSTDWNNYGSSITRVVSGSLAADGLVSKTGNAHALINSTANIIPNTTGAFGRLGGYNGTFGLGFVSSVDVYFDMTDGRIATGTYGWDLDQAVSNSSAGFLRDFVYHVGGNNTGIYVCVGNNSNNGIPAWSPAYIQSQAQYATITASGWYTMEWEARNNAGFLSMDFNIRNAVGAIVWTTTINTTDAIAGVGGNRYMWFNFIAADKLAIDNTSLQRKLVVTPSQSSGTAFNKGTTTVTCNTADACGKTASCNFDVVVNDNENPTVSCPTPAAYYNTDLGLCTAKLSFSIGSGDNCPGQVVTWSAIGAVPASGTGNLTDVLFPKGTTAVNVTVTDASFHTATCSFNVKVEDHQAPVTVTNGSSTVQCVSSATAPTVPTASDNCNGTISGVLVSTVDNPGSLTCEGSRVYTYSYTDLSANVSYWTYTYTIDHTTPPSEIGGPVAIASTVECESAATAPVLLPNVQDVCGNVLTTGAPTKKLSFTNKFDAAVTLAALEATGVWYTDRYNPKVFTSPVSIDGGNRLLESIDASDYQGTGFYKTQGRAYNVGAATDEVKIQLYVPAAWEFTNRRMAGFWGVALNTSNAVSGYPIVEFASDAPGPRFQVFEDAGGVGAWVNIGLPAGFAYDKWVTLKIRMLPSGEFLISAGSLNYVTTSYIPTASVRLKSVILQGYNYTNDPLLPNGVTYDIYWDDFTYNDTYAPVTCEGAISYTYDYADCSGLPYSWTYTYNIDHTTPPVVPANGAITVACLSAAVPPLAEQTVDQQQTSFGGWFNNNTASGQSFTCGISGKLTQIDVSVYAIAGVASPSFEIYLGNGPFGTPLYSAPCSLPGTGWQTLSIPQNVAPTLVAGTQYTFWITGYIVNSVQLGAGTNTSYAGGNAWDNCNGCTPPNYIIVPYYEADLMFKTYMNTAPVITDVCGTVIPTPTPIESGTYDGCEGTKVYTYNYADCSGLSTPWVYTYTIDYSGGLTPPANATATVSCPSQAVDPGQPAAIMDACGRTVNAILVTPAPTLPECNGIVIWRYRYTDCDGTTTADWTKTYTVTYSGGLTPPTPSIATVSCPSYATDPGAPASITDACGRTVNAVFVSSVSSPASLTCNGSVIWLYRYVGCDGTTTADWAKTYTVLYSGGLTPPSNGSSTVSGPAQAVNPGAPATITDACGRNVVPTLVGSTTPPACDGTVVWTYRYTACDGTTTADWTFTYTIIKSTLSGKLKYNNSAQTLMDNVVLTLTPGGATCTTHDGGNFEFTGLCPDTYTIAVTTNTKARGGINSTDAGAANYWSVAGGSIQHVKFLAGDATNDHAVNSTDALKIQRYFVYNEDFTRTWSYWKQDEMISNNWDPNCSQTIITVPVSGNVLNFNIYAMCTGDFNGSFNPSVAKSTNSSLTLTNDGIMVAGANQEIELPIRAASAMEVSAVSLILDIPSDMVEVQDIRVNGSTDPVTWTVNGNELRIGWNSTLPVAIPANGNLLTLTLKTTSAFTNGNSILLNLVSDPLNELADANYDVIENAVLLVNQVDNGMLGVPDQTGSKQLSLSNYPNPFYKTTTVTYEIPYDGKVTLEVHTMLGQKVTTLVDKTQVAGKYTLPADGSELKPGIYSVVLRLKTNDGEMVRTIKFIVNQ